MKLFLHIGAGKTGTSSIQHTLRANDRALRGRGVQYLGLMLEHAAVRPHRWQKPTGSEVFHHLPPAEAADAVADVLRATVQQAQADGLHTLVWSNESLFDRNRTVRAALRDPRLAGLYVQVVAYVRQPMDWLRSAYLQWGVKHKTYAGPLRSFSDWAGERLPRFADVLEDLHEEFGERLIVCRHDPRQDVVADFLRTIGVDPEGLVALRSNDTPAAHELVLRALYNARFQKKVLPQRFERLLGPDGFPPGDAQAFLDRLMDDDEGTVSRFRRELAPGLERVNAMLASAGLDPLPAEAPPRSDAARQVDEGRLLMTLCQLVVNQAVRIDRLEDQLESLLGPQGERASGGESAAASMPGDEGMGD